MPSRMKYFYAMRASLTGRIYQRLSLGGDDGFGEYQSSLEFLCFSTGVIDWSRIGVLLKAETVFFFGARD